MPSKPRHPDFRPITEATIVPVKEGQIWRELDPRNDPRFVEVLSVVNETDVMLQTVLRRHDPGLITYTRKPGARVTWPKLSRFNAKRGNYGFFEEDQSASEAK